MTASSHYVIRGGVAGRERLRLIASVLAPSTTALFDRLGISGALTCLDLGCGGGDVTLELARRVAPDGTVIGIDMDETKIEIARQEAAAHGVQNVDFRISRIDDFLLEAVYDVVYARFLLTHLPDPESAVERFRGWLRPGGRMILEDIDFTGYFVYPESAAFSRYHELYCEAARRKGGDPDIGRRLPLLLQRSGLADIGIAVAQPLGIVGDVKLISPVTMENIADAVIDLGLSTREEVTSIVQALYDLAADATVLGGVPRIVQTWATQPC